jgi:uncharacterized protein (TIGR02687 family)
MNDRIIQALAKLFERHRIIFWADAKQELRDDFATLELAGVEKIELANNEFAVKYRILREQPDQKFLLYRAGPPPADLDNWLLDVQLAYGEFRTDQIGLWLAELELGLEFAEVLQAHAEFFQSGKRREALKRLLKPDDTFGLLRLKMLAICAGAEPRLDAVLEQLLGELAAQCGQWAENQLGEKYKLIKRCQLNLYWWEQLRRYYGYESPEPSIKDFAIQLFQDCYFQNFTENLPPAPAIHSPLPTPQLSPDALIFLKRWKDSRQFEVYFQSISAECAEILGIEQDLTKRDFRDLIELDYYRLIDQKIISDLVKSVTARTVSAGDVALWVRQRRQGHWYREYCHLYEAVDYAAQFLQALEHLSLEGGAAEAESRTHSSYPFSAWFERYVKSWFRLDQLYRKFTYHVRTSGQASLMASLTEQIENLYSNNYLLKVNDRWQTLVDGVGKWDAPPALRQKDFFEHRVRPFLNKDNKICVIVSDALRFEIGEELLSLIRQEDRYDATLEPALAMLPSYTQLGMAALLPHKELLLCANESGTVLVDGQSSQGLSNRIKILVQGTSSRATALKTDELMALKGDDCRTLVRDHDVIYVYHNRIDATGDKRESEERVFEAVEETLQELIRLIKKLNHANIYNFFVTADHGFIYQNRAIDESDYISGAWSEVSCQQEDPSGTENPSPLPTIHYLDRRFILGKNLPEHASLRKFQAAPLGLVGDVEVQIPKSINRLRLKGSGSRFVHGGASLQEVVIPVLKINKKRQSDIAIVDVDILRGSSSLITAGQLAVAFYQAQGVSAKLQPRILRAGIYTLAGELISDSHELTFDLTSDNPREREFQARFVLTHKADEVNGQEVILKLEEKIPGTSHFKEYKSMRYQMQRSFTSDFDF